MKDSDLALGIDIGGTKMAAGIVDASGRIHCADRTPSPAHGTAAEMWDALELLIRNVLDAAGHPVLAGVGIGCAGPMVWPDGVVSPVNITAWRGFPLRRSVANIFPGVPVRIHNDAVAMAVGENWKGAAVGHRNALGMVVSTGVGGGLIIDGRLASGALGNAGHIGHIVVYPDGPPCTCGGRGCLEIIASGTSITRWALGEGWSPGPGEPADAKTLAAHAREGDAIAEAAFRRSGEAVGIALASVAALLDLDVAVIGGGLIHAGDLLRGPLHETFHRYAGLRHAAWLQIVPTALGDEAGIIGAAAFVHGGRRYWHPPHE